MKLLLTHPLRLVQVLLDKLGLEVQQRHLKEHNASMQQQLRVLSEGSSICSTSVRSPTNTLMILNHQLQAFLKERPGGVSTSSSRPQSCLVKQTHAYKARNARAIRPATCLA